MGQINLTGEQVLALSETLREYGDGGEALLTASHGGDVVVATTLATITIGADGAREEN